MIVKKGRKAIVIVGVIMLLFSFIYSQAESSIITITGNFEIIEPQYSNWSLYLKIGNTPKYDINKDMEIGPSDLSMLTGNYMTGSGERSWILEDINDDGYVNALDLSLLVGHYMEKY